MNNFMEVIKKRRSVRKYQAREVPEKKLQQVLEAVRWSPSWANTQCWEVIVVRDPAMKAKLQTCLPSNVNPSYDAIAAAPVVLVLCARARASGYYKGESITKFGDWLMFDLGIAAQSLCLSAHALGLGTVIIGAFDHQKAKETVNVPEGFELLALVPVGYPEKIGPAPQRREIDAFAHYDRW